ncbi:MAG: glycoside hydrolase family 2 [Planctomycetaceae bacterium]|nr:glycoside hydrolase family 2 [Planctomycetaceae bacterium]
MRQGSFVLAALIAVCGSTIGAADWKPKQAPLMTRWAKDVSPENALPEYPRPQMVREKWLNLNGLWDYAIRPKDEARPAKYDGQILVPFPVESALSGVMERVGAKKKLWYRRDFETPAEWKGQRLLLHFGAVDWETTVWVNGKEVGTHQGGYDPFSFDVTDAIKPSGSQELLVGVWDPTTDGPQPVGKQHTKPEGIWYTPTTGIWQTVWIEPVPKTYIRGFRVTPDIDTRSFVVEADIVGNTAQTHVMAMWVRTDEGLKALGKSGPVDKPIRVEFGPQDEMRLWTPDDPFLYHLLVTVFDGPNSDKAPELDRVLGYFAMRKSSIGPDADGVVRLLLNDKPLFQYGLLDQGFWPDGLYTAPTDEALKYDIEITKKMGFNLARKHVKVEPARWYHWCDKLGLLVWQDMPSGDKHVEPGKGEITRTAASTEIYNRELKTLIDALYNVPSIVMWVPFNEGWGQFETVRVTEWVKKYDPSRIVTCASGWNDFPVGDVHDVHVYPGPASPQPESKRAAVLGEFGGLGLPLPGHTWQSEKNWGYRSFTTKDDLAEAYFNLIHNLRPLVHSPGLSAAIYTQTTDVEIEVNGLLTYDREIIKIPVDQLERAHQRLYRRAQKVETVVAMSQKEPQTWRYTTSKPDDGWEQNEFVDTAWQTGPAGFGEPSTPGTVVRTGWKTPDIWIRRTFDLPENAPRQSDLLMHHDEDATVYINGVLATKVTGYTSDYQIFEVREAAREALRPGKKNVLAIHCKQTGGGQYIDAGLIRLVEPKDEP